MKNSTLTKILSAVVLAVLLCATVAGAWLGIAGRNTEYVTIRQDGQDVQRALYRQVSYIPNTFNTSWQQAIRPAAALAGGYRYTLTAEDADSAALSRIAKVAAARARLITGSASAKVEGDAVALTVPEDSFNSLISAVASAIGQVTFALLDTASQAVGESVMGMDAVKNAYYSANNNTYQVQVLFNSKGVKAYNDLRQANAGSYLYLVLDGQPAAYAALSALTDGVLSFTANDWSTAFIAVDCLRTGALPAAVTMSSAEATAPTAGSLLNIVIILCAVALLAVCVLLLALAKKAGLAGVWTLVAWVVLFCLFTALIAVNANWIMTVPGMIVLVLCVCAFLYGLVALFRATGAQIKNGRSAQAAFADASRRQLKPLGLGCAALAVIGLVLMMAFQSGIAGVLGRVVLMSAVLSFVMLFLFPRVVLGCWAALKAKK